MAGPNSAPNGDTRLVVGHSNSESACEIHGQAHVGWCEETMDLLAEEKISSPRCSVGPLRWYLLSRGRLKTGKTNA